VHCGVCTLDVRQNALDVGHAAILNEALDGTADHGVLAHQDDSLSAEGNADLVHLLGCDVVDGDDEDALVRLEQHLQLVEVRAFRSVLALSWRLGTRNGYFAVGANRGYPRTPIFAVVCDLAPRVFY
jgi:hypothetical protein